MFAVSQHRSKTLLSTVIAGLALAAFATPATARVDDPTAHGTLSAGTPVSARGTDVAAADQQSPRVVVNAPGTDVRAIDQQSPRVVANAPGTDVRAIDQQSPIAADPLPVDVAVPSDDSLPPVGLLVSMAFALAALGGLTVAVLGRRARATA